MKALYLDAPQKPALRARDENPLACGERLVEVFANGR